LPFNIGQGKQVTHWLDQFWPLLVIISWSSGSQRKKSPLGLGRRPKVGRRRWLQMSM
jgi:hypothetical protein